MRSPPLPSSLVRTADLVLFQNLVTIEWQGEKESIEEVGVSKQTGQVLVRVDARYFVRRLAGCARGFTSAQLTRLCLK